MYTREGTPKEGKIFHDWLNAAPFTLSNQELHVFQAFARNTFLLSPPVPAPSSSPSAASSSSSAPSIPATPETPVTPAIPESPETTSNETNTTKTSQIPRDPFHFFKISKRSTSAQVSLLSAITHMCALASAQGTDHPLFHKMLYNPADLANVFIPGLPDDDMQMFMGMSPNCY